MAAGTATKRLRTNSNARKEERVPVMLIHGAGPYMLSKNCAVAPIRILNAMPMNGPQKSRMAIFLLFRMLQC